MYRSIPVLIVLIVAVFVSPSVADSRWSFDLESGVAFNGYNDARIPGDLGTKISLSEELQADPAPFVRFQLTRSFGDRHHLTLLAAPLRIMASGTFDREVRFADSLFPAGTPIESRFRFDSYRLTYRYDFYRTAKLRLGFGFSAKIRDASISLTGPDGTAEKTNTGFVPLLNFLVHWRFHQAVGLMLYGDGLAAPQGRAEDFLVAVTADLNRRLTLRAGYRILEGGADNDEVYTFTLVNYLSAGLTLKL